MRHVTRHVERLLYAFEEHYCGRCGMHCSSHGLYIIHPCDGPAEWPVAIPERVRYAGEHEKVEWRRQRQVVSPREPHLTSGRPRREWGVSPFRALYEAAAELEMSRADMRRFMATFAHPTGIEP